MTETQRYLVLFIDVIYISELIKIAMFLSTRTSVRRGGLNHTELKTVIVPVCGNLRKP